MPQLYIIAVLLWDCLCYIHKLNRLYYYNNTQLFNFNCDKEVDTYIYASSRDSLEISYDNITSELDPKRSEHCTLINIIVINYISCQNTIQVKSDSAYQIIQGELYYEQLLLYNNEYTYELYTGILFFHFIVIEQLLATISISFKQELMSSYYLKLYQSEINHDSTNQFQYYENFHYSFLEQGEYFFLIAGPENLQFIINLQTKAISQYFIYTNCSTSIDLYKSEYNQWYIDSSYILIKPLIGAVQISYYEDPEIIELCLNDSLILIKTFDLVLIQQVAVLLYKPLYKQFIYSEILIRLFLYKHNRERLFFYVQNYISIQASSPRIQQIRTVQLQEYFQVIFIFDQSPHQENEIIHINFIFHAFQVVAHEYQIIQIDKGTNLVLCGTDYDISYVQGQFQLVDIEDNRKLLKAQTFITIYIKPQINQYCKLINLQQVYKLRYSDNKLCFVGNYFKIINVILYPSTVDCIIHNYYRLKKQLYLLDIASSEQFYYIFINNGFEILPNRDCLRVVQPFILFPSLEFQILKIHSTQAIERQSLELNDTQIRIYGIESKLAYLVKYNDTQSTQLFADELTQLQDNQAYILIVDVNTIKINIQPISSQFVLLINVQTFDSSKSVKFPSIAELSDYAYINKTIIMLNLEFYDCLGIIFYKLAYDCLLKIIVQHSQELLEVDFKKCNPDLDDKMIFEFDLPVFFCNQINQYEIITLQGLINTEDQYIIRCTQSPCAMMLVSIDLNLTQIEEQVNGTQYKLAVNNLLTNFDRNKHLLIVKQQSQFVIHSNSQFSIKNIMDQQTELQDKQTKLELIEGIYLVEFSSLRSDTYITMFTVPTILYKNIVFSVTELETFILDDQKDQFIIIEFKQIVEFQYIQFENNYITSLQQHILSFQLSDLSSLLRLSGQFYFTVHYTNHPCVLINDPTIQIIQRFTNKIEILIKVTINEQCSLQKLRIKYKNNQKDCTNIHYHQCVLQLDYAHNQLNTHYELLLQSNDYEYIFTYAINLDFQEDVQEIVLKIILIGLLYFLIYSTIYKTLQSQQNVEVRNLNPR